MGGTARLPALLQTYNLHCAPLRSCPFAGTSLMVGLTHTWEPLTKMPSLESVELR